MPNVGFRILPFAKSPSAKLLKAFKGVVVAHLSDSMQRLPGADGLNPMHKGGQLLGVALTVRVAPGDNLMVHKAIDIARPGDVIVVDAGGDLSQAIIGEMMSTAAAKRGLAGMVIDGAVRDSGALAASRFPVYARGVTHRGPYKNGPGEINVPVSIGGMVVSPGDIIVGDDDGVIAVPQDIALVVLAAARAKAKAEDAQLATIRKGGKVDRSWVDAALKAKGCDF
ncbi:MAG: RraA family protein [Burkholderiales bacterium]